MEKPTLFKTKCGLLSNASETQFSQRFSNAVLCDKVSKSAQENTSQIDIERNRNTKLILIHSNKVTSISPLQTCKGFH